MKETDQLVTKTMDQAALRTEHLSGTNNFVGTRMYSTGVAKLVAPEIELHKIVRLVLTPRCNARCFFCHNEGTTNSYFQNCLPLDKLVQLLEIFRATGVEGVSLTGGEPLLHTDFVEIAHHAVKIFEPARVHLTTNGILLKEKRTLMAKISLGRINVSIPSIDPAKYAEITGIDILPPIIRRIEDLAMEGTPSVHVNVPISQELNNSEEELRELLEFWKKRKIHLDLVMLYHWYRKLPRSKIIHGATVRRLLENLGAKESGVSFGRFRAPVTKYEYGELKVSLRDYIAQKDAPVCKACDIRARCVEGINSPRFYLDGKIKPCLLGDPIDLYEDAMQDNWPHVQEKIEALQHVYLNHTLVWIRR